MIKRSNGSSLSRRRRRIDRSRSVKADKDPDRDCHACKERYIIPGASHTDLYDGGGKDAIPFDKIETLIKENLK